jgi:hypothetical protein
MMTKKDFIALADAIRDHNTHCIGETPFTANHFDTLAAFCRGQNSRFDPIRWFDYIRGECGPNGGAIRKPEGSAS